VKTMSKIFVVDDEAIITMQLEERLTAMVIALQAWLLPVKTRSRRFGASGLTLC